MKLGSKMMWYVIIQLVYIVGFIALCWYLIMFAILSDWYSRHPVVGLVGICVVIIAALYVERVVTHYTHKFLIKPELDKLSNSAQTDGPEQTRMNNQ